MPVTPPFKWNRVVQTDRYFFAEFEIPGGVIEPGELSNIALTPLAARRDLGIVFSGRGPVWLYAHLTHLAHAFAWVAVHDPRRGGAIVVQRHVSNAPSVGEVIPCPPL
ncbi:MAG: CRISPR-associated protein Csx3 [Phycisphaerales bacterium]|nr:CRISPR-associated protein Csx3 [Phycisphaerales bacterium]